MAVVRSFFVCLLWQISRTGAHEKYPDWWAIVKGQLDMSLKESYEKQADNNVKLLTWLRNKKDVLSLFVDREHIDALLQSDGKWEDSPHVVKAVVMASATGKCMFKNVWLGCARDCYVSEVDESLKGLEHNGFKEEEYIHFKA